MTIAILTVCSGNICRSPFAEYYLRSRLAASQVFAIASAGSIAKSGDVPPVEMVEVSRDYGIAIENHQARYLSEAIVEPADLILALSREHRTEIVKMVPRKLLVTFTLREFALLSSSVPDEQLLQSAGTGTLNARVKNAARLLASRRSELGLMANPSDLDVIDPYHRGQDAYELSVSQMAPALDEVVRVMKIVGSI